MHIEFNTFQKRLADLKLSTNTYLMSVAAVFQKLISKFNAIIATIYQLLLQYKHSYIRLLSNCGKCICCAAYFYIHKPKQPELTPSGHLVTKDQCSKRQTILSVLAVHRPFYISICISCLPKQHTTFISIFHLSLLDLSPLRPYA